MTGDLAAPLLSLKDVAVSRGGRRILEGVSFVLSAGETILLKGANGAGKTTLLRAISQFLPTDKGNITVAGNARAVYCGHSDGVKTAMTVKENATFWATLYGAPAKAVDSALSALDMLELADRTASDLSAGQRRRLALARVIISGKAIWLLDEPSASMDAAATRKLIDLITDHARGGGAAIVATHDLLEIPSARSLTVERAAS